jgi:hypothetical protein
MSPRRAIVSIAAATLSLLLASAGAASPPPPAQANGKPVNPTAAIQADFLERVNKYVELQKKLEATLPKLPTEATPQQIDRNQRALGELVAQARKDAKPGDLFTPGMQKVVRMLMVDVFSGARGRQAKKYVHDEPHPVMPEINKRYPDIVPLSTMPLRVLSELPKLPEGLEYRFVQNHLILMDVHAHVILDYVLNAIPG